MSERIDEKKEKENKDKESKDKSKGKDNISNSSKDLKEEKIEKEDKTNPETVFINLTVISTISSGDKLTLEDKFLNIDNSYFQCVTRWMKGVNRNETLKFINEVLTEAFKWNDKWIEEKNVDLLLRLMTYLKNALKGLNNMKQTYPNDKLVHSEIDVMMENINSKLHNNSVILQYNK
jgi:hypothetical protein